MKSQHPDASTYNLLFVCTGNTCRSPMAASIAQREIERREWGRLVSVRSAGTAAFPGEPASPQAVMVAREHGLADLEEHRASRITRELVDWADLVLVMSRSHLSVVEELGGAGKAALVTEFLAGADAGAIEDPFGASPGAYRRTWAQLEEAIRAALDRLEPIVAP